jgi:hypothetical protein
MVRSDVALDSVVALSVALSGGFVHVYLVSGAELATVATLDGPNEVRVLEVQGSGYEVAVLGHVVPHMATGELGPSLGRHGSRWVEVGDRRGAE